MASRPVRPFHFLGGVTGELLRTHFPPSAELLLISPISRRHVGNVKNEFPSSQQTWRTIFQKMIKIAYRRLVIDNPMGLG
jgi:hypothetical protein